MKKIIVLLMSVVMICAVFSSCISLPIVNKSDEELIKERIDEFVNCYNDGDYDALVECMSKKTRNTLKSAFNIMGGLSSSFLGVSGISFSDLFGLSVGYMSEGDMLTLNITDIEINDDKASAFAVMAFDMKYNYADSKDNVKIFMVKEGKEWFIEDIKDYTLSSSQSGNSSSGSNFGTSSTPKETVVIDPFAGIEYFVSGISPYCEISVNNQNCSSDAQEYVTYSFDKEKYKNGETVVVTATLSRNADKEKYLLKTTTSQYTVSNQPEYITSIDGIDLSIMKSELDDFVSSNIAKASGGDYLFSLPHWTAGGTNYKSCDKVVLKDTYFSSLKNIRQEDFKLGKTPFNMLSYVYEIDYTWENINIHKSGEGTAWFNICAENIIKYSDGHIQWGVSSSGGFDFVSSFSLNGLEDCITTSITVNRDNYNISKVTP